MSENKGSCLAVGMFVCMQTLVHSIKFVFVGLFYLSFRISIRIISLHEGDENTEAIRLNDLTLPSMHARKQGLDTAQNM